MKNRLVRVRELLQRELGAILARDHAFPSVLVTVNDVDITPDLRHAFFFVGVIGPEHDAQHVIDTLNRQRGELQKRVSKRVILKNTPHFHFRLDHSVERGVRITAIMETIDQQLAESAARDAEAGVVAVAEASEDEEEVIENADIKEAGERLDDDEDNAPKPPARRSSRHSAPHPDDD